MFERHLACTTWPSSVNFFGHSKIHHFNPGSYELSTNTESLTKHRPRQHTPHTFLYFLPRLLLRGKHQTNNCLKSPNLRFLRECSKRGKKSPPGRNISLANFCTTPRTRGDPTLKTKPKGCVVRYETITQKESNCQTSHYSSRP